MNKQDILDKLPERIRDQVVIIDKGDKYTVAHPYIDESLYALTRDAIEKLPGAEVGTYFDGVMHYYIPKEIKPPSLPVKTSQSGVTPHVVSMDKTEPPQLEEIGVKLVNVDKLVQSPYWPRELNATTEEFKELVKSIRKFGVQGNLLARLQQGRLELVFGHRRLFAARQAGLKHIPVKIRKLTDEEALQIQFEENDKQKRWTGIETARYLETMMTKFECTQAQLAEMLGKSQSWVSLHLSLVQDDGITAVIESSKTKDMTEGKAREFRKLPIEAQKEIIKTVQDTGVIPTTKEIRAKQPKKPKLQVCEGCGVASSDVEDWNGHGILLCSKCLKDANVHPERYLGAKKTREVTEEIEAKQKPFTETWAFRKNRMHPKRSKFEDLFDEEASNDGLPYGESNVDVCVQKKNVDKKYETPKGTLFVEFLGPPHEGKEDKDDEKSRLLLRQPNTELIEFKYKSPSTAKAKEAVNRVRAKLVEMEAIKKEAYENA